MKQMKMSTDALTSFILDGSPILTNFRVVTQGVFWKFFQRLFLLEQFSGKILMWDKLNTIEIGIEMTHSYFDNVNSVTI